MKESDFLKLCQRELKLKSMEAARERKELFWNSVKEALEKDKRVVFKDWGIFYIKDVKSRKYKIPCKEGEFYSEPRSVIKFICGKRLRERVNRDE